MKSHEIYIIAEIAALSRRALNVLNAVHSFKNHRTNLCNPRIDAIAQRSKYNVRNVQYAIAELVAKHIIQSIPQYHKPGNKKKLGGNTSNSYIFTDFNELKARYECIENPSDGVKGEPKCTLNADFLSPNAPLNDFSHPEIPINSDDCGNTSPTELSHYINLAISSDLTPATHPLSSHEAAVPAANVPDYTTQDTQLKADTTAQPLDDAKNSNAMRYVKNIHSDFNGGSGYTASNGKIHTEKEEKNAGTRKEDPAFPLEQLLRQCRVDLFEQTPGAGIASEMRSTLTEIYFADELRLFKQRVPRAEFFPALRYLNYDILTDAYKRVNSRPANSIRDRAAYFSATIFNSIKNFGKPPKRKSAALAPSVPAAADLLRLEQLLERQRAMA
jgi:hypothetical protein